MTTKHAGHALSAEKYGGIDAINNDETTSIDAAQGTCTPNPPASPLSTSASRAFSQPEDNVGRYHSLGCKRAWSEETDEPVSKKVNLSNEPKNSTPSVNDPSQAPDNVDVDAEIRTCTDRPNRPTLWPSPAHTRSSGEKSSSRSSGFADIPSHGQESPALSRRTTSFDRIMQDSVHGDIDAEPQEYYSPMNTPLASDMRSDGVSSTSNSKSNCRSSPVPSAVGTLSDELKAIAFAKYLGPSPFFSAKSFYGAS